MFFLVLRFTPLAHDLGRPLTFRQNGHHPSNLSRTNSFTHGYGASAASAGGHYGTVSGSKDFSGRLPLHHQNPRVLAHRPFSFTQGVPPPASGPACSPVATAAELSIPEMSELELGTSRDHLAGWPGGFETAFC